MSPYAYDVTQRAISFTCDLYFFLQPSLCTLLAHSFVYIKAYKQGLGYPKQQFIIYGWYDDEWWIVHESERQLSCTQKEIAETLDYTLAPLVSEFYSNTSLVTEGGLVSVVEKA